jgi:hypothetical protein
LTATVRCVSPRDNGCVERRTLGEMARSKGPQGFIRARLALGVAVSFLAAAAVASAGTASPQRGWISGLTQISFGCPGPVREGAPPCEHWSRFAHARFSIVRLSARDEPRAGSRETIVSDSHGRFRVAVPSGRYLVTPLPQPHTRGGTPIHLRVRAGTASWVLVRFHGVPQML